MARRRYQRGTLFQRGTREKVWVGRWLEDEIHDNQLIRVRKAAIVGKVRDLSKKQAQRELDKLMSPVNSGTLQAKHHTSFRELATKWKTTILPTHKPSAHSSEKAHIKHLTEFFGDMDVRSITGESVQNFVQRASAKFQPKYVKNIMVTFRLLWKTAFDWGYVDRDERLILRSVRLPELGLNTQPCFTVEQSRKLIDAAAEPFKTMFWLAAETGIRGGELCALGVDDVKDRIVSVRRSSFDGALGTVKTANAVRLFPISQNLADHIAAYRSSQWKDNPERLLFANKNGGAYRNKDVVTYKLHPLMDSLGIPRPKRIGLHALRHGSATVLDSLNAPIAVRKDRLGHGSFSTTLNYTHAISRDHFDVADRLGPLFDPSCPISQAAVVESSS